MALNNVNTISIITATFNSERYIEQTILSVVQQTSYSNIEYIIVDGASTDSTMEIVNKYRDAIHQIISEPDKGIYDAFNKGIQAATGDAIYFLNSDDYLTDNSVIKDVLEQFSSDLSLKAVYGDVICVNETNGFRKPMGRRTTLDDLRLARMLPHQGLFVRKNVFDEFGLFDLSYKIVSDFDATIKMFKKYESHCLYINRAIAIYRFGGPSSNLVHRNKMQNEFVQICEKHFGRSLVQPLSIAESNIDYYKRWLETLLLKNAPISAIVRQKGITNAVIVGTVEMSLYVLYDLQKAGIQVHAFLDNDSRSHGMKIDSIMVYPVEWLADRAAQYDAIILAFEGNHDDGIRRQIHDLLGESAPQIFSWRQMVMWNVERDADK